MKDFTIIVGQMGIDVFNYGDGLDLTLAYLGVDGQYASVHLNPDQALEIARALENRVAFATRKNGE